MAATALAIAVLCLMVSWRIIEARQRQIAAETRLLSQAAASAEERIAESYRQLHATLRLLTLRLGSAESLPTGPAPAWLADAIRPLSQSRHLLVIDAADRIVSATRPDIVGMDVAARPYVQALKSQADPQAMHVSLPIRTATGERDVVFVSMRIPAPGGVWAGAVAISLDVDFFNRIAARIAPPGPGNTASLTSTTGIIFARHPDPSGFIGKDISTGRTYGAHMASGLVQTEHQAPSASDGVERLTVVRSAQVEGGTQLLIFVARRMDQVLAPWLWESSADVLTLLASITLIGALAWLAARREGGLRDEVHHAQEESRLFRNFFMGCKAVELIIDPRDGRLIDANDAAVAYYGWSRQDLLKKFISDINTLSKDDIAAEIRRAQAEERSHFLFRHRLASGEIRDVEVHSGPIDYQGRQLLYSIIHDITDRCRLEAERQRLVLAIEQSPASLVITDTEGRIDYVNPAFTRVTGYTLDEVRGETPRILKSGHTPDDEYRTMWQSLSSGTPWTTTFLNKRKDGSTYWERAHISPVLSGDQITGYLAVKEDISELIQAQENARSLHRQLQAVLDAASEVSIIATDRQGIITLFNRGSEIMLGYRASDMIGQQTPEVIHLPAEIERRGRELSEQLGCDVSGFRVFAELADRQGHDSRQWTYVRQDGSHLTVSLMVTPLPDSHGGIAGYLGIAVDVTLRNKIEQTLAEINRRLDSQARELKKANEELEQFAYVASHDLREPLRMVASYLTLLERRLGPNLDEDGRTFLAFAVDGAKRMDGLIRALLDYSRIGRRGAPFAPVKLGDVVETALQMLSVGIAESAADIAIAPGLPTVFGDGAQLLRLFDNLIGNAIKYRSADRPLRLQIGWRDDADQWVVWVQDNGVGIAPEDHDRAFAMFQRLDTPVAVEGSGIGLAICSKIVQHHGGRIWIESTPGEGSRFLVALPKADGT